MADLSQDLDSLVEDLQKLIHNQQTSDVIFHIGQKEVVFYAHKLFLWARCKYFQKYEHQFWRSRSTQGPLTFKYPQYDPQLFSEVLRFIYTGQIRITDSSVFALLLMSRDLGLDKLTVLCEGHLMRSISDNNACQYLSTALEIERENPELGLRSDSFVKSCKGYIETHADGCVQSEGWLELPKPAVIQLIGSEKFALEEENVWRAVLAWAKYNAGIPLEKHPRQWNPHEKQLVSRALEGVVEKVKFMVMDSRVFAEEVEPTGVVPMEQIVEKYRNAVVAESPSEHSDYTPRICFKFFQHSSILDEENSQYHRLLNQWYGDNKQMWTCVYRASREGFGAEDFHRCCDGKSPTYVLIQGNTGSICGGFSDVPWTSNTPPRGRFIPSRKTFLFTIINNQDVPPTKFDVTKSKYATIHHPDFGPMFGAGADLCIASNCNQGMECYSNFPHSYGGDNASCSILMGDYNFNVLDYEVFTPLSHSNET